ncbi:MAG: hypothetical protein JXA14_23845 [Anaerolineae bacterium]|nr:hypothetical protein [Anaerolineae bacterium]
MALTRDKVRHLIELEHDLPVLTRLPEQSARLEALHGELDALDLRSTDALRDDAVFSLSSGCRGRRITCLMQ